jgi:hypothetical protein
LSTARLTSGSSQKPARRKRKAELPEYDLVAAGVSAVMVYRLLAAGRRRLHLGTVLLQVQKNLVNLLGSPSS